MTTLPPKRLVIEMHPKDNVLVALTQLAEGQVVEYRDQQYAILEPIQSKHKFYTTDLAKGAYLADLVAIIGSMDLVMGEVDR